MPEMETVHEALNQWIFVYAAYAIGVAGTVLLTGWSLLDMCRAEVRREKARGR